MKRVFVVTCFLAAPAFAQMQMPMPMGNMPQPARSSPPPAAAQPPAKRPAGKSASPAGKLDRQNNDEQGEAQRPSMPFGRLADGDTSGAPRPVPATPTPTTLSGTVQQQEHPEQRVGTDSAMPDLLADAKGRAPESLRFFTDEAAKSNPTLQQAQAQVRRLQAEARQAGLWQNPEIGYEADHVRGGSYAGGEQGGYLQQTIPLAGQRSSSRAAIQAQVTGAESLAAAQRQRVEGGVMQAFYAALVAQREVELRQGMAALAEDAAIAAHQFANIGQADAPDVLASEVEREQAKMDLASAQRGYRKAFVALASASGNAAMPVRFLQGDLTAAPVLPAGQATQIVEGSLTLQSSQQQALAGDAAVRAAKKQAGPQLTLKAGLQQDNEPLDSAQRRVGVVGIAQAGLTLPIWNRNQGAVEAARAQQASAKAEVIRTELSLRMQAEQTLQDYANAIEQVQRYRDELLPRAAKAVTLYQQKYAAMAAAYPQTVAAQKVLLQLQIEYARALGAAWQSAVLLQHGLLSDPLAAPEVLTTPSGVAGGS